MTYTKKRKYALSDREATAYGGYSSAQTYRRNKISDHAVVRYMERKYGANFDVVREEMLCEGLKSAIKNKATAYTKDGIRFAISKEGVVTTVMLA